jgi:hypothetical protein
MQRAKMFPPEKRARIISALKKNPNARAVARQLGEVSSATVWNIAKQEGIELAAGKAATGGRLPPEKRAKIVEALKRNPNATAVARQMGDVSLATVSNIAKQEGIELAAGKAAAAGRLPPEKRAKIVEALKNNPNATAVARQMGDVSLATVWNIAKQEGIELAGRKAAAAGHQINREGMPRNARPLRA